MSHAFKNRLTVIVKALKGKNYLSKEKLYEEETKSQLNIISTKYLLFLDMEHKLKNKRARVKGVRVKLQI